MVKADGLNCPICSSISSFLFVEDHGYNVYKCANDVECGHMWTPPRDGLHGVTDRDIDIEAESNHYLNIFGERNKRLLRLFLRHLSRRPKMNFLDYGAGNAHISRSFKAALGDAVDIYCLEAHEGCKKMYGKYNLTGIDNLGDLTQPIDLAYIVEVVEHLPSPVDDLRALAQHLSEDSVVFISTPAGFVDRSKTNAFASPFHLHYFTDKSLNKCLELAGFDPIEFQLYTALDPLPSRVRNWRTYLSEPSFPRFSLVSVKDRLSLLKADLSHRFDRIFKYQVKPSSYPFHLQGFTKLSSHPARIQ